MTHATVRCAAPPRCGRGARLWARMKTAFRALRHRRARADAARWEIAIQKDLAHLDRHLLRDIGLDRDAQ